MTNKRGSINTEETMFETGLAIGEKSIEVSIMGLDLIKNILLVTRAADQTEIGVYYYDQTGGQLSSRRFIRAILHSKRDFVLFMSELLKEMERDEYLMAALCDDQLDNAIASILKTLRLPEEVLEDIIAYASTLIIKISSPAAPVLRLC